MKGFSLERTIVISMAEGRRIEVGNDRDALALVEVRMIDPENKVVSSMTFAPASVAKIADGIGIALEAAPEKDGEFQIMTRAEVWNDDSGSVIEISQRPDGSAVTIVEYDSDASGKRKSGNLTLTPPSARVVAKALVKAGEFVAAAA